MLRKMWKDIEGEKVDLGSLAGRFHDVQGFMGLASCSSDWNLDHAAGQEGYGKKVAWTGRMVTKRCCCMNTRTEEGTRANARVKK